MAMPVRSRSRVGASLPGRPGPTTPPGMSHGGLRNRFGFHWFASRAAPRNKAGMNQEVFGLPSAFDTFNQEPGCLKPELLPRLVDAGQRVLVERAVHGVVVANDRELARDRKPGYASDTEHLKGHVVRPAEYRVPLS